MVEKKATQMYEQVMNSLEYIGHETLTSEQTKRNKNKWPNSLTYDSNDPLNRKYLGLIAEREYFELFKRSEKEIFREWGFANMFYLSVSSGDLMLDISMPEDLMERRGEVLKRGLNSKIPEEQKDRVLKTDPFENELLHVKDQVDGIPFFIHYRKPAGFERKYHSLQSLGTIGLPSPVAEGDLDIKAASKNLADEILRSQIRFLNRRGVRIPVQDLRFKDFGYTHIDLHKDANDQEKILVRIFVGETPYVVKLDKYLNFDLEGRKLDVPSLQDNLQFILLSYLKPILCDSIFKDHKGQELEVSGEVISRMEHLMLLPEGKHRRERAIENCRVFESKDLLVLDTQKREMLKATEKPVPSDREYTYVKPVIEKEENLPPITIHLPGVLQFS